MPALNLLNAMSAEIAGGGPGQQTVLEEWASGVQPEEPCNKDYDDYHANDVKDVHFTLQRRHARLQYESTMLQRGNVVSRV
jgi:hypothetical protein